MTAEALRRWKPSFLVVLFRYQDDKPEWNCVLFVVGVIGKFWQELSSGVSSSAIVLGWGISDVWGISTHLESVLYRIVLYRHKCKINHENDV